MFDIQRLHGSAIGGGKSDICNGDLLQDNGIKGCVTPHRMKPPEIGTLV